MIKSDEIIEIIKKANNKTNISSDTQLLKDGILDSLSILNLIMQLNKTYNIEINIFDIVPENFATAESIANLVNSKRS